jgi:ribosomal protein L29
MHQAMAATMTTTLFDKDRCSWALEQAALIRSGRTAEIDLGLIAETLEEMTRSDRRELRSRLAVLLQHLLKWRFQPSHRTPSWKRTIRTQRREIESLLDESPSLKRHIETLYPKAYEDARNDAADETGLPLDTFPETNPWSYDDAMTEVVT